MTRGARARDLHPGEASGIIGWLFPLTYAVHLVEEYAAPEWFGAWSERVLGLAIGPREFIAWNALAFALMCAGTALSIAFSRLRWIEIAMSIGVLGNAMFHLAAGAATLTYSPGVVTGVLLWVPLGASRLWIGLRDCSPRGRRIGISVGVSAVLVSLGVLAS